jgi:iron complex transport system substrate-binding protein
MSEPRVISLIASATEIVCALGFERQMVGRSHECDFPASVKQLPVCASPKFQVEGLSYEIDERVKAILQEALSVYRVDADLLEQLRPTHIITQSQCEVCAVSLKDVEEAVCQFTSEFAGRCVVGHSPCGFSFERARARRRTRHEFAEANG